MNAKLSTKYYQIKSAMYKKLTTPNAGKRVEQEEVSFIAGENTK